MIDYEAGESCGQVCGIPRAAHQTEEHPWVPTPAETGLREAVQEFIEAPGVIAPTMERAFTRLCDVFHATALSKEERP